MTISSYSLQVPQAVIQTGPLLLAEQAQGDLVLRVYRQTDGSIFGAVADPVKGSSLTVRIKNIGSHLEMDHLSNAIDLIKNGTLTFDGENITFVQRGLVGGGNSQSSASLKEAKTQVADAKRKYAFGSATKDNGNLQDARWHMDNALRIYAEVYGKNHITRADGLKFICQCCIELKSYEWALQAGQEAQTIYVNLKGQEDQELTTKLASLPTSS